MADETSLGKDPIQDRIKALGVFSTLSQAFATGLDDSESQAYGNLLKDLMDNSALLVSGGLMSAKEVLDKIEDLQQHIRKSGTSGKSVTDIFHGWLSGKDDGEES